MAQKKVSIGKSSRMRDAKDITKKSAADIASIFRLRADVYSLYPPAPLPSNVDPTRRTTLSEKIDDRGAVAEKKKRRRDKKRNNTNSLSGSDPKKKKKNRKCAS